MKRLRNPLFRPALAAAALLGGFLLSAPKPAAAQATITADAGLAQYYRTEGWLPVRVTLTNQGAPARVEVRARFSTMGPVQEYRIPERELPNGANTLHTLYMKSPRAYGNQPLIVDFYRDGRLINTVKPYLRPLMEDSWLVYGVGPDASTAPLTLLTSAPFPPRMRNIAPPAARRQVPVSVAVSQPNAVPDRWQGLSAADLVVLSGASERDFRPEQLTALREYVAAGGTLVVTGGLNWNRLATPFFQELLPARVTGSAVASSLPVQEGAFSGSAFPVMTATPKPDAEVVLGSGARPLAVRGSYGSGRVLFLAFDPTLPPLRDWSGLRRLWPELIQARLEPSLVDTVQRQDDGFEMYSGAVPPGYYGGGGARLADAPFAIPQLDIPAFYIVALFLLAYIVVLVPINYFVLKARDKKEYAWLTTPAIVAVFSVGAYLIGYGFKGGNTLAVQVGVVEARANDASAPFLSYSGLFSPRKTGYDVRFASAGQPDPFSNALFAEPGGEGARAGLRLVQDEAPRIEDLAVDMWAMRVVKAVGVANLGSGFQSQIRSRPGSVSGSVSNGTPFHLEDCSLVVGSQSYPLGDLPAGGSLDLGNRSGSGAGSILLPGSLTDAVKGRSQEARMRRAILEAVSNSGRFGGPAPVPQPGNQVRLVGWFREPVGRLQVDGKSPRTVSETLMVVRLD